MLTVHHLGKSQSERIVWLCEELEIPYELLWRRQKGAEPRVEGQTVIIQPPPPPRRSQW